MGLYFCFVFLNEVASCHQLHMKNIEQYVLKRDVTMNKMKLSSILRNV